MKPQRQSALNSAVSEVLHFSALVQRRWNTSKLISAVSETYSESALIFTHVDDNIKCDRVAEGDENARSGKNMTFPVLRKMQISTMFCKMTRKTLIF